MVSREPGGLQTMGSQRTQLSWLKGFLNWFLSVVLICTSLEMSISSLRVLLLNTVWGRFTHQNWHSETDFWWFHLPPLITPGISWWQVSFTALQSLWLFSAQGPGLRVTVAQSNGHTVTGFLLRQPEPWCNSCSWKWKWWWHPTPVLLPGKSHGRRSLVGCGLWGREESDRTERLHFHFSLLYIGEGNGNSLQCSCLENPRAGRAWWAAVYGGTQSRTRLKWLY